MINIIYICTPIIDISSLLVLVMHLLVGKTEKILTFATKKCGKIRENICFSLSIGMLLASSIKMWVHRLNIHKNV